MRARTLALLVVIATPSCGGPKSALRTEETRTFTAQIVSIEREPETNRPRTLTLSVVPYATVNQRVPLYHGLQRELTTENLPLELAEGDRVELAYDDRMPPADRAPLEVGQQVVVQVKYQNVTPPAFIGSE
jgi:hypothetical protein